MKVVSFFSGAGGLDLGFALAGHEIIWANDFDMEAVETYNNNIGKYINHEAILGDITEMLKGTEEDINNLIPDSDIIIGGFPCQGFTIANLDRSMEDKRNYLYLELLKAISVKKPQYFLLENVKGLENMDSGKIIEMIINDLKEAGTESSKFYPSRGDGYCVFYNVLNALNFGVPENRERVIILGIRKDIYEQSPLKKFVSDKSQTKKNEYKRLSIPYTHFKDAVKVSYNPINEINSLYEDFINGKKPNISTVINNEPMKTTTLKDAIYDLPRDYDSSINNHTGTKCKVTIKNKIGNRATSWDKEAPTIMGRGSGTGGPLIPPHPDGQRRLSVRETARIQTFPDKFYFYGSNSCGYRQIGNAVPVLMAINIANIFNVTD